MAKDEDICTERNSGEGSQLRQRQEELRMTASFESWNLRLRGKKA